MNGSEGGDGARTGLRPAHTTATLPLLEHRFAGTLNDPDPREAHLPDSGDN